MHGEKSKQNKFRLIIYTAFFSASLAASLVIFIVYIRPVYLEKLQLYADKKAVETVNTALESVFLTTEENYNDYVLLEKKSNGTISAVKTDTVKANKMRSKIANALQKYTEELEPEYITVTLGSIFSNEVLSGIGPQIKIKIVPESVSKLDFENEFEACGINQTRHTILLTAAVEVSIITSAVQTKKTVSAKIPIAETIIMGEIPNYYGMSTPIVQPTE